MDKLPNFDAPPVVERVLGAQFSALPEFTTAHAGWYWREHLDSSMKRVIEAPRIEDQFERFGAQRVFQRPSLQVLAQPEPNRIQIIREDSERMVQVQNSRFIYNWQKGKGLYPRYGVLLAEFNSLLSGFIKFVDQAKLGTIQLNQWEVTYVNHLPRGREWTSVDDLREMLPGFTVPAERVPNQTFDSFGGQWQLALGGDRGRLHILVQHAKRATDDQEIIQLTLTARGPVDEAKGQDLRSGLELGHEAIVLSFEGMTSDRLQSIWGKKA